MKNYALPCPTLAMRFPSLVIRCSPFCEERAVSQTANSGTHADQRYCRGCSIVRVSSHVQTTGLGVLELGCSLMMLIFSLKAEPSLFIFFKGNSRITWVYNALPQPYELPLGLPQRKHCPRGSSSKSGSCSTRDDVQHQLPQAPH